MNFMSTMMVSMSTGAMFYLADYVTQTSVVVLMAYLFIPLALGVPITGLLVKRFGAVKSQQLYLVISGLGLCAMTILPVSFIPVSIALAGLGLSGTQTLTYLLLGQVIDEDEVRTGVRREGAFYGANALITKPAESIAIALMPFILQITRFVTREQNNGLIFLEQPSSALFGIRAIVGLIPGIALLIGAIVLHWYPLKGKYLLEVKEKILAMHAEKFERYMTQQMK